MQLYKRIRNYEAELKLNAKYIKGPAYSKYSILFYSKKKYQNSSSFTAFPRRIGISLSSDSTDWISEIIVNNWVLQLDLNDKMLIMAFTWLLYNNNKHMHECHEKLLG